MVDDQRLQPLPSDSFGALIAARDRIERLIRRYEPKPDPTRPYMSAVERERVNAGRDETLSLALYSVRDMIELALNMRLEESRERERQSREAEEALEATSG